jgi:hypothetical protein
VAAFSSESTFQRALADLKRAWPHRDGIQPIIEVQPDATHLSASRHIYISSGQPSRYWQKTHNDIAKTII